MMSFLVRRSSQCRASGWGNFLFILYYNGDRTVWIQPTSDLRCEWDEKPRIVDWFAIEIEGQILPGRNNLLFLLFHYDRCMTATDCVGSVGQLVEWVRVVG